MERFFEDLIGHGGEELAHAFTEGTAGHEDEAVGELGALLDYREPFTARIEKAGEVLVLPADQIAAIFRDTPDIARRLQRLSLLMLASKLEKTSPTLAGS